MRISDWSSDVCSSDLTRRAAERIDHRREAETHRIADHLAREQRRGEPHLEHEADREPDHDLADDEEKARDRDDAFRRQGHARRRDRGHRSEEHTSELQSLMRNSYAVFCLKKKKKQHHIPSTKLTCDKTV